MAFNDKYLTCIGDIGTTKPNIWVYKTDDAAATVDTSGYCPVGYGFKVGDVILRVTVTNLGLSNEAGSTAGWHLVVTASSTAVDVADTTALTVTNTD